MADSADALVVRLDADLAAFQHQLDRARAQLSKFATGSAAPVATAADNIGKAAGRSLPGLGKLGNAFENIATRATGLPGVLGKAADVFGSFAIGNVAMVAVFAGLAGAAALFRKITEEARETKKAAEDALNAVTNAWLSQQTQGDIDLINQQRDIGAQLDVKARQLERAKDARENKEYLAKLEGELADLRKGYDRATELLTARRADRQREEAERTARAEKKAASDAAQAWRKAYAEMEAAARARAEFAPPLEQIALPHSRRTSFAEFNAFGATHRPETAGEAAERLGFFVPTISAADSALEGLRQTVDKVDRQFNAFTPPGGGGGGGGPGFLGRIGQRLGDVLNPEMIVSGLATGFLSQGISLAISGLGKVGKSLLGLGSAADEAAVRMQSAVNSIRGEIARMRGDTEAALFYELQAGVQQRLEALGFTGGGALKTTNIEELQAFLAAILESFSAAGKGSEIQLIIDWLTESMEGLGNEVNRLTDSLRNIPTGFKIALAEFNATTPSAAAVSTTSAPLTIRIEASPDGIFQTVERRAVMRKRSGGSLAWELV